MTTIQTIKKNLFNINFLNLLFYLLLFKESTGERS